MLGMGTGEIIAICVVLIVLFGVNKLPALGAGLGKGIRDFQRGVLGKDDAKETKEVEGAKKEDVK